MFQSNVSMVNAGLWMLDDHAHVMQVKLCKANTRGVIAQLCRPPWPMSSLLRQASEPTLYTHRCGTSRRSRRWWPHCRWPRQRRAWTGQHHALFLCVWRVGPVDRGARMLVCICFDFLNCFHRFEYQLPKFISRARGVQFWWNKFWWIPHEV